MNFNPSYTQKIRKYWLSLSVLQKVLCLATLFIILLQIAQFHLFDEFLPHDVDLQHNLSVASMATYSKEYPVMSVWPGLDVKVHSRYPPVYQIIVSIIYFCVRDWGMAAWLLQIVAWLIASIILIKVCFTIDRHFSFLPLVLLGFNRILLADFGWMMQGPELISLVLYWQALIFQKQRKWGGVSIMMGIIGMTNPLFLFWGVGIFIPLLFDRSVKKLIWPILTMIPIVLWKHFFISTNILSPRPQEFSLLPDMIYYYGLINLIFGFIGFIYVCKNRMPIFWPLVYLFFLFLINPFLSKYIMFIDHLTQIRQGINMFLPFLVIIGANALLNLSKYRFKYYLAFSAICFSLLLQNFSPRSLRMYGPVIWRSEIQFMRSLELSSNALIANSNRVQTVFNWCTPLLNSPCLFWRERGDPLSGSDLEKFNYLRELANKCIFSPTTECIEEMREFGVTHAYVPAGPHGASWEMDRETWQKWVEISEINGYEVAVGPDNGGGRKPVVVSFINEGMLK